MYASPMKPPLETQKSVDESVNESFLEAHIGTESKEPAQAACKIGHVVPKRAPPPATFTRADTFREANSSIGRAAERKGVKVREYDRNDRWLAWRKRGRRVKRGMEVKAARDSKKQKGKKSNKGVRTTQRKK